MTSARRIFFSLSAVGVSWIALTTGSAPKPVSAAASLSAGETLFHEKGCAHCHGEQGAGTERGPNLRGVGRRLNREQIEHQIHDGGENMPPFADAVDEAELKALVDYLATRKARGAAAARSWPQPVKASPSPPQP